MLEILPKGVLQIDLSGTIQIANAAARSMLDLEKKGLPPNKGATKTTNLLKADGIPCAAPGFPNIRCLIQVPVNLLPSWAPKKFGKKVQRMERLAVSTREIEQHTGTVWVLSDATFRVEAAGRLAQAPALGERAFLTLA